MIDILIVSVPGMVCQSPPAAPALLKASVIQAGFSCQTIDFNILMYKEPNTDIGQLESYFTTGLNPAQEPLAKQLIQRWVDQIIEINPTYVGISVFTYQNRIATRLFCEEIKKRSNIKIVLGGQGLSDGGIQGLNNFGQQLVEIKLADYWIRSEGEVSLVELLKNNFNYPGINSNDFKQVDDLDSIPFPDYSDYDFTQYECPEVPITGSRGCVRSCSFCDIHEHWKYRYRTGKSMVDEIIHSHQTYNVTDFMFTDSLINGNLKEFKIFIKLLADYNRTQSNKITWLSQFIVRSEKTLDPEYWQNLAESGARMLAIGVETGSDTVRAHMNKKFTNQDLDYTISMLAQHNITCQMLMIVGYPTETDDDFQQTLDMFTKYQPLAKSIIKNVSVGSTLGILPGTPLYYNAKFHNIELDKYENNWVALDNPELTFEKRLERLSQLTQHLANLGYYARGENEHTINILESKKEMFAERQKIKKIIRLREHQDS